jgi:hypothetical protein
MQTASLMVVMMTAREARKVGHLQLDANCHARRRSVRHTRHADFTRKLHDTEWSALVKDGMQTGATSDISTR